MPAITGYASFLQLSRTGKGGTAVYIKEEIASSKLKLQLQISTASDRLIEVIVEDLVILEAYASVNCEEEELRRNFYNSHRIIEIATLLKLKARGSMLKDDKARIRLL